MFMAGKFIVIVRINSFLPSGSEEHAVVDSAEDWDHRGEYTRADRTEIFDSVRTNGGYELGELPGGASNVRNVDIQNSTLDDGALEQRTRLVGGRVHVTQNVRSSRRRSEEGDIRRVAAKVRDEAVNPFKRLPLVAKAIVADALFACGVVVLAKRGARSEAKQPQAVAR